MENILRHIIPRTSRTIEGARWRIGGASDSKSRGSASPTCNTVLCLRAGFIKSTANTKKEVAPSPHD